MDQAIQNVMKQAGLNLRDAVALATRNPARVGRIRSRQRGLTTGERADLVRFRYDDATKEIEILETYLDGRQVYAAGEP
jgi:N-acetylglucosamine-6-phosphate deacetylase